MRRLLLLSVLVLTFASPAEAGKKGAQKAGNAEGPKAATVTIGCGFEVGTTARYAYEHVVRSTKGEASTSHTSRAERRLTVVASDDTGIEVEVVDLSLSVEGEVTPMMRAIPALAEGAPGAVRVRLDHGTGQVTVQDAEAYAAALQAHFASRRDQVVAATPGLDGVLLDQMLAMLARPELATKDALEAVTPVLQQACVELVPGPTPYEVALPNFLGGAPLPAKGTLTAHEKGGIAQVETREQVDSRPIVQSILEMLRAKGIASLPPEMERIMAQTPPDVSTRFVVRIDAATGWPIGWTIERRTVAPPFSHRIDEIKVKRLP